MSENKMQPKTDIPFKKFMEFFTSGEKIESDYNGSIVMSPEEAFKFMEDSGAFISWLDESVSCQFFAPDTKEQK